MAKCDISKVHLLFWNFFVVCFSSQNLCFYDFHFFFSLMKYQISATEY